MSISLDSLVGELQIVAGAPQSTTPATHVATAPRRAARGRAADTVYVLCDLPGAASSVLGELIEVMLKTYWATPGSVTAALRAAVAVGSEWLMDRNVNAQLPDRQSGGLSCAVLRGSEVFIAQAGPASAYVAQHGTVQHFPAADAEPMTALGMARAADVRYAHADLQPGDSVVLTDSRWAARLPIEAVASAIVSVRVAQALINLAQLAGSGDLIAVAIEAAGAVDATVPVESAAPIEPVKPIEPVARSTPEATARPIERPAPRVNIQPPSSSPAVAPQPDKQKNEPEREPLSVTAKAWLGALFQGARRGAGSVGTAGQMVVQRTLPEPATTHGRASSVTRGSAATRSKHQPAARALNTPLLAGIAISIPILVSLLAATLFIQGQSKAELETRLVTAQNAITLASQRTGAEARVQWNLVKDQATEALVLDPGNATATGQLSASPTSDRSAGQRGACEAGGNMGLQIDRAAPAGAAGVLAVCTGSRDE